MAGSEGLLLDVRPGQLLELGSVRVELVHKTGRAARLRVTAPREVSIKVVETTEISSPRSPSLVPSTAE